MNPVYINLNNAHYYFSLCVRIFCWVLSMQQPLLFSVYIFLYTFSDTMSISHISTGMFLAQSRNYFFIYRYETLTCLFFNRVYGNIECFAMMSLSLLSDSRQKLVVNWFYFWHRRCLFGRIKWLPQYQ